MTNTARFLFFIGCILGVYFLPWWLLFTIMVSVMVFYRIILIELLIPSVLVDVLYSVNIDRFLGFEFVATLIMVCILFVAWLIKTQFRL